MAWVPPVVAPPQPGAAPEAAQARAGVAVKHLGGLVSFNMVARAGGAAGISDEAMGASAINALEHMAGGAFEPFLQQMEQRLQQGMQQGIQQGMQQVRQEVQQVRQEVQTLKEMTVTNYNVTARLHNRTVQQAGPLLPLRTERQPAAAAAAPAAAPQLGDLPGPGLFPPSWAAFHDDWTHVQVTDLAVFYQEDFGQHNMPLAQRKQLFGTFISRV